MRHKCTVCNGLGWYPDGWGNSPTCMACNGKGYRPTTAEPHNPKLVEHLAYSMFKADYHEQHPDKVLGEIYLNGAWAQLDTRKRWRRLAKVALRACVDDTNPDDIELPDPLLQKVPCPQCRVYDTGLGLQSYAPTLQMVHHEYNQGCRYCDFTGSIEVASDNYR